jgi:hypothetical protein
LKVWNYRCTRRRLVVNGTLDAGAAPFDVV